MKGTLGSGWFLSSLAAIAEDPVRISKLILNSNSYPKSGMFRFQFWVRDQWIGINIDDRLPVKLLGEKIVPYASTKGATGGWWIPLFEKAYAKLDQNYDRIVGGSGGEGLKTLTGLPVVSYFHRKINNKIAWNRFSLYSDK